jgi:hypothetical protein
VFNLKRKLVVKPKFIKVEVLRQNLENEFDFDDESYNKLLPKRKR